MELQRLTLGGFDHADLPWSIATRMRAPTDALSPFSFAFSPTTTVRLHLPPSATK